MIAVLLACGEQALVSKFGLTSLVFWDTTCPAKGMYSLAHEGITLAGMFKSCLDRQVRARVRGEGSDQPQAPSLVERERATRRVVEHKSVQSFGRTARMAMESQLDSMRSFFDPSAAPCTCSTLSTSHTMPTLPALNPSYSSCCHPFGMMKRQRQCLLFCHDSYWAFLVRRDATGVA